MYEYSLWIPERRCGELIAQSYAARPPARFADPDTSGTPKHFPPLFAKFVRKQLTFPKNAL